MLWPNILKYCTSFKFSHTHLTSLDKNDLTLTAEIIFVINLIIVNTPTTIDDNTDTFFTFCRIDVGAGSSRLNNI